MCAFLKKNEFLHYFYSVVFTKKACQKQQTKCFFCNVTLRAEEEEDEEEEKEEKWGEGGGKRRWVVVVVVVVEEEEEEEEERAEGQDGHTHKHTHTRRGVIRGNLLWSVLRLFISTLYRYL
jgi:hypothetical protein